MNFELRTSKIIKDRHQRAVWKLSVAVKIKGIKCKTLGAYYTAYLAYYSNALVHASCCNRARGAVSCH